MILLVLHLLGCDRCEPIESRGSCDTAKQCCTEADGCYVEAEDRAWHCDGGDGEFAADCTDARQLAYAYCEGRPVAPGSDGDVTCTTYDPGGGQLECDAVAACCDEGGTCWHEANGMVYPLGEEAQLVCDVCEFGATTSSYVCP